MGRGIWRVSLLIPVAVAVASPATFAQVARPPAARPQVAAPSAKSAPVPRVARPAIKADDPKMKALLKEWEQRSSLLTSLDVVIKRTDKDPAWGDEVFIGRALLQSPNKACLNFQKEVKGPKGNRALVDSERIVCTGTEVWQYKPETKQIFIFPLDPERRKRALEEGPLPFLFQMKAAEAEARYQMNLIREEADYYVIGVLPKLAIDQESFCQAFLKLNRATYLPDRIYLISPNEKSIKDFELSNVRKNVKIRPENFAGNTLDKSWQVVRDPQNEAPPAQRRLGNQPQRPAGQPARLGAQPAAVPATTAPRLR